MFKKLKNNMMSLAVFLAVISPYGVHAMEPENREVDSVKSSVEFVKPKEMTFKEKRVDKTYKFWLFQQVAEDIVKDGTLPDFPRDMINLIGGTFYKLVLTNQVLDAVLGFTRTAKKPCFSYINGQAVDNVALYVVLSVEVKERIGFKIRDLLKDGVLDLWSKNVFCNLGNYSVITIDPEKFFHVVENSKKLVVFITPRHLIEEKLGSTTKPFASIMADWKRDPESIGIFIRGQNWKNPNDYNCIINVDIGKNSESTIFGLWQSNIDLYKKRWDVYDVHRALGDLCISFE